MDDCNQTMAASGHASGIRDACIRVSRREGRHLVAIADLDSGHTVYDGEAFAAALYDDYVNRVCACCFRIDTGKGFDLTCTRCRRVYYCSEACRGQHRQSGAVGTVPHHLACAALQRLGSLEEQGSELIKPRLIIEVMARRHHNSRRGDVQLLVADEFESLEFHRPPDGWADGDAEVDTYIQTWCEGLRDAIAACEGEWRPTVGELTNESICAAASRIDVNGFDCLTAASGGESIGIGLYAGGASMFNHHCDPNCSIYLDRGLPSLVVKCNRAVKKGEKLTIAYLDVESYADREERRARLRQRYCFECDCTRCVAQEAEEAERAAAAAVPPRLLSRLHGHGAHYMLAAAIAGGGYWLSALLTLAAYFLVWMGVFNFPL